MQKGAKLIFESEDVIRDGCADGKSGSKGGVRLFVRTPVSIIIMDFRLNTWYNNIKSIK